MGTMLMPKEQAPLDLEPHRRRLMAIAYRMLGSVADAEDVVQEAFVRWQATDRAGVLEPRAFLSKIVTRLCLDQLKSARRRREIYVGEWLPEPVLDAAGMEADAATDYADDLSVAFLLTLERLSPLERAAFLLHDVFDMDFVEVGKALERSPEACRQLASRARVHVQDARPRFPASDDQRARLAQAFYSAITSGDVEGLAHILARDAVLHGDGGGKRIAALRPIFGRDKILRFLAGIARKIGLPKPDEVIATRINGVPGFIILDRDGGVDSTFALEIADAGIVAIYAMRNPDKLKHINVPPKGESCR